MRRNKQRSHIRSRTIIGVVLLSACLGASVGVQSASADAYGCTGYGRVLPSQIQPGQFCGDIKGSGALVRSVGAGFTSLGCALRTGM